jgi:potassium efflux system protein
MKKKKTFLLSISMGILSFFIIFFAYYDLLKESGSIQIAFVGPMSGKGKAAGKLMKNAIKLYLDQINQKGGINGKTLTLDVLDDQNDTETARLKAIEIVEKNQAVAVIGHWYSSASISAGEIYKKEKIPAITPGSVNIKVTENNEWYFRNIYNAKAPGQFLANYVKYVFSQKNVSIISENAAYGSYLAEVFKQESIKLGLIVKKHWLYNNDEKHLEKKFKKIVNELKSRKKEAGVILLAVQATEGVRLVQLIKDAGIQNRIIGGSSLSEKTFRDGFDKYSVSKEYPGYYTNDIYVATPLMFDTANEKAQTFFKEYKKKYNEVPDDWSAAYAYDTVMILVKAIKKAKIQGIQETLKADRQKIRNILASFTNIYEAEEGVTGFNYFNTHRDAEKPVSFGVYKHKQSVSALTQFQIVRDPNEIAEMEKALLKKDVLQINDRYMYKTNVVYVGLNITEISDINIKKLQFTLGFQLWFRFAGDFNPQDIEFVNAVNHFDVKQQLEEKSCKKQEKTKNIIYTVCRIKSTFRADFIDQFTYKQHTVGVSFRHRTSSLNHLIYVKDILGMGMTDDKLLNKLKKDHVISPTEGWTISSIQFYPDIIKEYSAGNPEHLNKPEGKVEYSRFNALISIKKDELTLRGVISYRYAYHIMVFSGIIFLILTLTGSQQKFFKLTWFFQVIFAVLLLLSGEIIFAEWLDKNTTLPQRESIIRVFDILWWIIPAFLFNVATERFIWKPLEEKMGPFPVIIRHFFALLVYFFAIIGVIVFVYEQPFTSLLAASGVIAMIIGLAIQINISNVFSGIVINMERPFKIGNWVKIGQFTEGEVIDMNWRATQLQGRNGCILSIPNSVASESSILNFHYPSKVYWLWPTIYVHPKHSPMRVKKILLDALLSVNTILKEPAPIVFFTGINEWSASYWIAFCADDYAGKFSILEDVWTRVWFHLNSANLVPAVMRQEVHVFGWERGKISHHTLPPDTFKPDVGMGSEPSVIQKKT